MDLEWRLEVPPNIVPKSSHCEISTSVIRTDDQYKYQCRCRSGYEGNPYLPGGCQGVYKLPIKFKFILHFNLKPILDIYTRCRGLSTTVISSQNVYIN